MTTSQSKRKAAFVPRVGRHARATRIIRGVVASIYPGELVTVTKKQKERYRVLGNEHHPSWAVWVDADALEAPLTSSQSKSTNTRRGPGKTGVKDCDAVRGEPGHHHRPLNITRESIGASSYETLCDRVTIERARRDRAAMKGDLETVEDATRVLTRIERYSWMRLSAPGDKCRAMWRHASGWIVQHCGHPTANWPYYAIDPAYPEAITVTHNGLGFRRLDTAFNAVEEVLRGNARATDERCEPGVRRILMLGDES